MNMKPFMVAAYGLLAAVFAAGEQLPVCQPVSGESIRAGDLAVANPVFASLDPQLILGPSPMAGARREYRIQELATLVRRRGLPVGSLRGVCFEWPARALLPGAIAEAMGRVLRCDAGAIEVIDYSRFPAPLGDLVFDRKDLAPLPDPTLRLQLWRGFVRYGADRRFPIWARVRIGIPTVRIVALRALPPGQVIRDDQVERKDTTEAPVDGTFASAAEEVVGRVPVTRIEPGSAIRLASLKLRPDISAGDEVQVEVRNGGMTIHAVARAEQAGRLGDTIPLSNLQSSARFRARVEGRNKVSLTVQPKEQH